MAFNLSKNDGNKSKIDISKSLEKTNKFNLSKTKISSPEAVAGGEPAKSKKGVLIILGLALIAVCSWFFFSQNRSNTFPTENTVNESQSVSETGNELSETTEKPDDVVKEAVSDDEVSKPVVSEVEINTVDSDIKTIASVAPVNSSDLNNKIPATFSKGSVSVTTIDDDIVTQIISYLKKNSESTINVNGFASSEGNNAINQRLSQQRADSFKAILVTKGIHSNRIIAKGRGIDNPIASNDTEEGRIKNRRVEITF